MCGCRILMFILFFLPKGFVAPAWVRLREQLSGRRRERAEDAVA